MKKPEHVVCPYCQQVADFVRGNVIYPHRTDLSEHCFYLCAPCNAYVGTHRGTSKPLGRLANKELRHAKMIAHAYFDPVWRADRGTRRAAAYTWLAHALGIPKSECHIGMFDVEMCRRTVELCKMRKVDLEEKHRLRRENAIA